MRFGTKAALLGAAISALTVSGAGSAYADDDQPAHPRESHSGPRESHSGKDHSGKGHSGKDHSGKGHSSGGEDLFLFAKSHRSEYARFDDESSPAPLAAVPAGPLCTQSNTATAGDADAAEGATATGGAATASGNAQTQTCNITVTLPVGSGDQTVRRTSRVYALEEDSKRVVSRH
ncbi:hypothetical protein [Streptomyces sp.]|uniref:hypothetical protein n=1 Tax=Streptomyces sp. TaxID=1931 RepID=UPI002D640CB6|nr:hypothetical protein [Streptomyces sp.]HZF89687.1 hypothetical protein [Streptomyces sp.]